MTKEPDSPRAALSLHRIEEAALALIGREGTDFSMRKLAASLGCSPMSLYHHVPSRGHLMDALVDRIFRPLLPLPGEGLAWRARIEAVSLAWRAAVSERPALLVFLLTHRLNTPAALAWLDAVIALYRETTPDAAEAARRFRVTGYYLAGAVLDEIAGYTRGPSTASPIAPEAMAAQFPNVAAAAPTFAPDARERTFRDGLSLLLTEWAPDGAGHRGVRSAGASP